MTSFLDIKSNTRRQLLLVATLGFLTGLLYLPSTLQLMLGTGFIRERAQTLTMFFFPLCWSFLGLGQMLRPFKRVERLFPIFSALLIMAFLALSLLLPAQINVESTMLWRLLLCLVPASLVYFGVGNRLGSELRKSEERVHLLFGLFMLGIALGGIVADQSVAHVGGNGLLAILALCFLAFESLARPIVLAGVAACSALMIHFDVDIALERTRNVGSYAESDEIEFVVGKSSLEQYLRDYKGSVETLAWTRRGQTLFATSKHGRATVGILNLQIEFFYAMGGVNKFRARAYSLIKPSSRVALLGAGAGRSLQVFPEGVLSENFYAVERDEGTVKILEKTGVNPLSDNVHFIAADGRSFIEKSPGLWDWIILESAVDQTNVSPFSILQPFYIYTPEAMQLYMSRLAPGGTLVVEFHKLRRLMRFQLVGAIVGGLESIPNVNVDFVSITSAPRGGSVWIFARKGDQDFKDVAGVRKSMHTARATSKDFPRNECFAKFSDGTPLFQWLCLPFLQKHRALIVPWTILFVTLGIFSLSVALAARRMTGDNRGKNQIVFLLQSIAHCLWFMAVAYNLRSIFQDEMATYYAFVYVSTVASALSAFFMHYRGERTSLGLVSVGIVVSWICTIFALRAESLHTGSLPVRIMLFGIAILPVSFSLSLLFHVFLRQARRSAHGANVALLADCFGQLPGFAIAIWILFEGSNTWMMAAAGISYAACVAYGAFTYDFRTR